MRLRVSCRTTKSVGSYHSPVAPSFTKLPYQPSVPPARSFPYGTVEDARLHTAAEREALVARAEDVALRETTLLEREADAASADSALQKLRESLEATAGED